MTKPKVFIATKVPDEVAAYLEQSCTVNRWNSAEGLSREVLFQGVADADGLLTSGTRIDDVLLNGAPRLRAVSNIAVGYNNFDLEAMRRRGVIGTNTPYVLDDTVADLVLGLMLASARRIPELDRYMREGRWVKGDQTSLFGLDVHHRKLGIVGMGRIGEAVARRARLGFEMDVLYCNRRRRTEAEQALGIRYAGMEELLAESDFVLLMTPLTPETEGLFGERQFRAMKKTALFINASRGQTVREPDLIRALEEGWIRGAGLDVFAQEPIDPANPLLRLPNVVVVPHIGSATAQTRFDMAMCAAENLVAALTGGTPPNVVEELRSSNGDN